ncbi:MAG: CPXCG motif-containing cysteine-rich protein [Jejuia sp.]
MLEHYFTCPYCWENISMLLDDSVGHQTYIEDCEVCCNPIEVTAKFFNTELSEFQATSIEQ